MTKQELNEKIKVQQEIISKAKAEINSFVKEYIKSLPIKVGDKCKDSNGKVCWIASIEPRLSSYFSFSLLDVRVNYAKKDGTRSNRPQNPYCDVEELIKI